jgi:hypothetical protein
VTHSKVDRRRFAAFVVRKMRRAPKARAAIPALPESLGRGEGKIAF